MLQLYKKMYATLVGLVDEAITDLVNIALLENCDKDKVVKVAQNLQRALQDVEEMYLDAEDVEDEILE